MNTITSRGRRRRVNRPRGHFSGCHEIDQLNSFKSFYNLQTDLLHNRLFAKSENDMPSKMDSEYSMAVKKDPRSRCASLPRGQDPNTCCHRRAKEKRKGNHIR